MKRILYTLTAAVALLFGNYIFSNSTLEAYVETATPVPPTAAPATVAPTVEIVPSAAPTEEAVDPYGELYLSLVAPKPYDPSDELAQIFPKALTRLVRLPGSCVVGLETCPPVEDMETPFDMSDVFATDSRLLTWSPDGRYGVLVVHPQDELSRGRTKEELEKLEFVDPSEFDVNPSTLYVFDSQTDTWQAVYQADRKFFYATRFSPDGQWIAFSVNSSMWGFHAWGPDDGIYIVRPDGSDPRQVSDIPAYPLGWLGNSLVVRQMKGLYPEMEYSMDMLTLEGEVKPLFDSARLAMYSLAPDGSELLAADAQGEDIGGPEKAVEVLALDGTVIHTFGTLFNYTSSIYPLAWSPDGSLVAFANQRRAYVVPRHGQGVPSGMAGLPPEVREVYVADDQYTPPSFWDLEFSQDNKYLLMNLYDGMTRFVTVDLDTGQSIPLEIQGMTSDEMPGSFAWRQ